MNYYNKLKKAVEELEQNQDITLKTTINHVVEYLNKAISGEATTYTTQYNKPREILRATITSISKNQSINFRDYLLLKIDKKNENGEQTAIFCFKLEERWGQLNEGGYYEFTVERGKKDSYILVDFNKIV